jgi:hypothetical protein
MTLFRADEQNALSAKSPDAINPLHYKAGGIECIDAIQAQLSPTEFRGYLRGQIAKYNWRLGLKDSVEQDANKLLWYASMLAGRDPRD